MLVIELKRCLDIFKEKGIKDESIMRNINPDSTMNKEIKQAVENEKYKGFDFER